MKNGEDGTIRNIIILTHGWSGSSVFSAFIGEAGYWHGVDTARKPDYNTYENAELVALNNRMLRELMPTLNHEQRFDMNDVLQIERAAERLDLAPYREFMRACDAHSPWIWKDPRLTWTIRIWSKLLPLQEIAFLVLTREPMQAWISTNLRRHVQSMKFTKAYNGGITAANLQFLEQHRLPYVQCSFEDLLVTPDRTIDRLNAGLGLQLTMAQLHKTCREPLYRKSRGFKDFIRAALIYAKNYEERDFRERPLVV